ncbi:MAG: type II secretion system protein M [Burkholderiales bacterium]|nr:type II secretion system protein M [Burkholderiales bacterium]
MATDSPSLPPALNDARQQAGRFWQARAPRERQLILVMAISVGVLLVWLTLIQPALRTLREAPVDLDRLDQQMQQMQLAAGEMQSLRAASPVPTEQATTALRAATAQLGSGAKLAVQGDRATLTFTGIQGDALRAWLGEARSAARARPMEAQLVKAASGYSGSVTVSLGAAS